MNNLLVFVLIPPSKSILLFWFVLVFWGKGWIDDRIWIIHHGYEDRQLDLNYFEDSRRSMKEAWKVYNIVKWRFKQEVATF